MQLQQQVTPQQRPVRDCPGCLRVAVQALHSRSARHFSHGRPRHGVAARSWRNFFQPALRAASSPPHLSASRARQQEARVVVEQFYAAYNAGDIEAIGALMADDVIYTDLVYPQPFVGKAAVLAFMQKVRDSVPEDLKFVVEDITSGDSSKVGVSWHVEIGEGTQFPFSRGCSFYTVNSEGKIATARDVVEGSLKPGSSTLALLSLLAPVVRQLGPAADPSNLNRLPLAAAAVWAFYIGYTSYIMLGTSAPGLPAYQTPPEVLLEVLHESLNFFYVNIGLNSLGFTLVPDIPEHPVSEALFNFVAAWGMMFLPIMLTEQKSQKVNNKMAWWTGIMFLTNVFFIPFLALRAAPDTGSDSSAEQGSTPAVAGPAEQQGQYPRWSKPLAAVGLAVGVFSVYWAAAGRLELYGDLTARLEYFQTAFSSNRVFYAFVVDAALYSVWQWAMLSTVPGATGFHKFVPFVGLAAHLCATPSSAEPQSPRAALKSTSKASSKS